MSDEGNTPAEDAGNIKDLLNRMKAALRAANVAEGKLHDAMRDAWLRHGHLLVDPGEVQPLAGEPKLPPGGGGGN